MHTDLSQFILYLPRRFQCRQLGNNAVEGNDDFRARLASDVVSVAHVDGSSIELVLSDHCRNSAGIPTSRHLVLTENEIVL